MDVLGVDKKELTLQEVKELLNVGEKRVRELLTKGELVGVNYCTRSKAGYPIKQRNITTASVAEYLSKHQNRGS